ncbi:hypothetical protein [Halobacillus ihumii]|uniref:hypothetical protein n=1 Tax=Halobacillus ihumii TaxID=2686092 RepID=UPI0013D0053D|nr:hypothetical protein [Halobacillus ihumii]
MGEKRLGIFDDYSYEILEIKSILTEMENGRIYEKTGARMDGSLPYKVQKLREKLNDLLTKIDKQAPSAHDEIDSLFE